MRGRLLFLLLLLWMALVPYEGFFSRADAAITTYTFDDPRDEERFKHLSEELRCLVCQNQSLADSNADLAQDLRREIYTMIRQGKGNEEIVSFMVARYGDFVLYRPPVKPTTYLLWLGPLLLFIIGAVTLAVLVPRWGRTRAGETLSDEEQHRLQALLDDKKEQRP